MAQTSLYNNNVLDSITGASDCTLNNSILQTKGAAPINMKDVFEAALIDPLTESLQVQTITPTVVASTLYSFVITQLNGATGQLVSVPIQYTSAASGETATTLCNNIRSMLALVENLRITASGTSTLILTALTGSPTFTFTSFGPGVLTAVGTVTNAAGTTKIITDTSGTSTVSAGGTTLGGTILVAGLANGDTVRYTLAGSDSVALRNGQTLVAGDVFETIIGNVTNSATVGVYSIGPLYDFRISSTGITSFAAARLVAPTFVAQKARGTSAQVTAVGGSPTSGNTYAELAIKYNQRDKVRGETTNHQWSTFLNTGDADYASTLRPQILLNLAAVSSGTTATPKASAIG